ncbi:MAG: RluA family pseudouridine synthase [Zetaproteobacteria bacterium CG_4_9_14_3_um_filter_49_83]|nr:MAG: ribosomal large subunit pseudouridine synthase C [Zetaproteobacteria bacterium CG1_02_49_23]PIQ31573.1 MAG: ribosomal large subunit pseudouridine synthase C [Zetaproteobacteria bacterium CG17_big_fil_post_rev_8_21_14_2_50_50_13]PIY54670.1 MAG: RluA family pseudouridine synthase [Zetaproteobacteria bacterium CG_4_10_14_0_8_um_filter_49_80]PJA35722.1 MAG: RluA family pseudouridine synthase [Zetaproteobacteria bacterium CG_4_9_14_3_um_filter_49_83]
MNETEKQVCLTVDANEQGSRLDRVLVRFLGGDRKGLILRLIRKGNVRVNGKRKKPDYRVESGDIIYLPASLREPSPATGATAEDVPGDLLRKVAQLSVLYEDDYVLVIDKPAGMVVHGGSGYSAGLVEALKISRNLPELRLAHRLDRDTSGVLLLAKDLMSLRRLTEDFREHDMEKTYMALVAGYPYASAGRMESRLAKGFVSGGERMVVDSEDGKASVTDYQVMMHSSHSDFDFSLLALFPHSGRTHQLRVQLQQEGHSILGDQKYAEKEQLSCYKKLGGRGLMLHAWRLRFRHPVTGLVMELRAPWPASWLKFFRAG